MSDTRGSSTTDCELCELSAVSATEGRGTDTSPDASEVPVVLTTFSRADRFDMDCALLGEGSELLSEAATWSWAEAFALDGALLAEGTGLLSEAAADLRFNSARRIGLGEDV